MPEAGSTCRTHPGLQGNEYDYAATPKNGFNANVSLSASGLPSGVTASFNPLSTTSKSAVTLSASNTTTTGPATVTIIPRDTGGFGTGV